MTGKRYEKRCTLCGAMVYSDSKTRTCYKCDSEMIIIKTFKKEV